MNSELFFFLSRRYDYILFVSLFEDKKNEDVVEDKKNEAEAEEKEQKEEKN